MINIKLLKDLSTYIKVAQRPLYFPFYFLQLYAERMLSCVPKSPYKSSFIYHTSQMVSQ